MESIRPGFETLNLAITDKTEDWNQVFLHILEELRQKGVQLEHSEALLNRMRREGARCSTGAKWAERLVTTLREEHRGKGFGLELVTTTASSSSTTPTGITSAIWSSPLPAGCSGCIARARSAYAGAVTNFWRIVRNLVTETQLGLVAGRDSEIVDSFSWEELDYRCQGTIRPV